jgi:hypothetical protein
MIVRRKQGRYVEGKQGGLNERLKTRFEPNNWLIDTTQTAREGSEIFIRNHAIRDRFVL